MPDTNSLNTADPTQRARMEVQREYEERAVVERGASLRMPTIDLRRVSINIDLLYLVSKAEAEKALAMPFFRIGKKVRIAVVEPENPDTQALLDALRSRDYQLNLTLTSRSGLLEALAQYDTALLKRSTVIENVVDESKLDDYAKEIENIQKMAEKIREEKPDVAVNYLLVGAMRTGASDLHLEPYEKHGKLRLRIDGVLQEVLDVDRETVTKLTQGIKHSAHLKLNVADRPQDGRFSFRLNERSVDVRVSTMPSIYGESVVLRFLDTKRSVRTLAELGLRGRAYDRVLAGVHGAHGMILSTGPTGSGKTTTQYALLRELASPEVKVITLEDPVEYRVDGITQSQISSDEEYRFADALRSVLRHDPDVVMVGEIRDLETAEIAAQAALTGHTVLSTLHTNDAVSTVPRLVNMGLATFVVAPALDTVIAQRLCRRVCADCREDAPLSAPERAAAETIHATLLKVQPDAPVLPAVFARGKGCETCSHTGFHGQVGLYEVFRRTREMETAILEGNHPALFGLARADGMLTLREDGLLKVLSGETTVGEVLRVTLE